MHSKKIGLLGGSFNPAHLGHVYISRQALEILKFDEVWWLVTEQNPLKTTIETQDFACRIEQARKITAEYSNIIVSDFEFQAKTRYTYDTIVALQAKYKQHKFYWLMGADNLLQLPKWYKWRELIKLVPLIIFNRGDLKIAALSGEVAGEFTMKIIDKNSNIESIEVPARGRKFLLFEWLRKIYSKFVGTAGDSTLLPAILFLDIETHPAASSIIRKNQSNQGVN